MPELPEVETIMRGMENALLNKKIHNIKINRYDLRIALPKDFGQTLTNKTILSMERRGKYIITHLDDNISMVLHLGMSGRVNIFPKGSPYKAQKHDHVVFTMDDDTCFAFEDPRRFGMLYISNDEWEKEKRFASMGVEPLDNWSGSDLFESLKNKKSPIKSALLDQRVVAGLGNIYVCEALFRAKIIPTRLSNKISKNEANILVKHSINILNEAIKAGGSTLKDYKHTDGSLGYFQHGFAVYDREGHACNNKSCASDIMRIVQAGRSTFYCPSCQK